MKHGVEPFRRFGHRVLTALFLISRDDEEQS